MKQAREPSYRVPCPVCLAKTGTKCYTHVGGPGYQGTGVRDQPHPARVLAAQRAGKFGR